jgi:iduronate 2-sulfatase
MILVVIEMTRHGSTATNGRAKSSFPAMSRCKTPLRSLVLHWFLPHLRPAGIRRSARGTVFRRGGLALLSLALSQAIGAEARPNVLFLIVDDLTTTLGCYGDRAAHTPNLDALAARGVRFERAYTQFALCNPSRASFLTGCYPERTKVYNLTTNFRAALPDAVTLPQVFKRAGYKVGRVGKVFHVPDPQTTVDVQKGAPIGKDQQILDEAKLAAATEGDLSDPPRVRGKTRQYNRNYAASQRPAGDFTDHQIAEEAGAALEAFKDQPFFLAVGFIRPHTPYVAPQAFFDHIDPAAIAMPAFYQPGGENRALIPEAALRPNNNVFSFAAPTATQAREARRAYLASTAHVDAQVGRVLAKLAALQLDRNTIILMTGDHGYQLGEHGLWAKQTLFEEGTRVPLIVAAPGVSPGVCRGLVEQVDIFPTLAGLARLPVPEGVQGRTLQPLLVNPKAPGKAAVFSTIQAPRPRPGGGAAALENFAEVTSAGGAGAVMGRSIRTERYRYIAWEGGRAGRQLYDHSVDPHELDNLADQPAQASLIAELQRRLEDHVLAVGGP